MDMGMVDSVSGNKAIYIGRILEEARVEEVYKRYSSTKIAEIHLHLNRFLERGNGFLALPRTYNSIVPMLGT